MSVKEWTCQREKTGKQPRYMVSPHMEYLLPVRGKGVCWMWWYTPVIPVLRRQKQEDQEFKALKGYVVSLTLRPA